MRPPLRHALVDALQWRLLLVWVVALALPTALVAWPLWRALAASLDHALDGAELARRFDLVTMMEASLPWREGGYSPGSGGLAALLVTVLLSPWLSGMVLTVAEADPRRPPGFAALARGGLAHYGSLGRLLAWSAVPLGAVLGVGALLRLAVGRHAEQAVLASDIDAWSALAWTVTGLLFLVVHASLEAGRARLATAPWPTSEVRAWRQGLGTVARRPFSTLACYLVPTVLGLAVATLLGLARLRLPAVGAVALGEGWLVTQATVAAIAWARCARLLALIRQVHTL